MKRIVLFSLSLLLGALPVLAQEQACLAGDGCQVGKMWLGGRGKVSGEVKNLKLTPEQQLKIKNIISIAKNEYEVQKSESRKIKKQAIAYIAQPNFDEQGLRALLEKQLELELEMMLASAKAREQIKTVLSDEQLVAWNKVRGVKGGGEKEKGKDKEAEADWKEDKIEMAPLENEFDAGFKEGGELPTTTATSSAAAPAGKNIHDALREWDENNPWEDTPTK